MDEMTEILNLLKQGEKRGLQRLFYKYYKLLVLYALKYVHRQDEAEALFSQATESAERCFPLCGTLWGEDASLTGNNGGNYWSATPSYRYRIGAHAITLNNASLSYGTSYRRSLGCMIRGIKE